MTNKSLSEWEQEHINILTSKQMGAWLGRRENRLLDEIRDEIDGAKMPKNRMCFFRDGIDCALEIIDKYKAESEDKCMGKVVYCVDCKYSQCWRSGESARKYGKGMECSLNILRCPDDYDFCSRGEKIIKCKNCGRRFDHGIPNFCPNCGTKMVESEDKDVYNL